MNIPVAAGKRAGGVLGRPTLQGEDTGISSKDALLAMADVCAAMGKFDLAETMRQEAFGTNVAASSPSMLMWQNSVDAMQSTIVKEDIEGALKLACAPPGSQGSFQECARCPGCVDAMQFAIA